MLSEALRTLTGLWIMMLMDDYPTARWSPDRKSKDVSVDPSGTVATKEGGLDAFGYIQTTEAVSNGVHTW